MSDFTNMEIEFENITILQNTSEYVPRRISIFPAIERVNLTSAVRENSYLYVDANGITDSRISLNDIKSMSTKIVTVNTIDEVDFDLLSTGDFIYLIKKGD